MESLRHSVIRGLSWSLVARLARQGLKTVIGITLVRLLAPEHFGLLAMVTVITNFARLLVEFGFGRGLVQDQETTQEHLSSVFWFNIATGFLLMVLFMSASPLIADFYDEPMLVPLTIVVSTDYLIGSLSIVQSALLTKELNFRRLAIVELGSVAVSGGIAIVMAWAGLGVWSLAIQPISFSVVTSLALWLVNEWRPSWTFSWKAINGLLRFGGNLLGAQVLNYWTRNIDYVLIGHLFGSNLLGIYSRAYIVLVSPVLAITQVVSKVIFPSFSKIQQDKERVKRSFLKVANSVSAIAFPVLLGLFFVADSFVLTFFGEQWQAMIPVLRVFCFVGIIQSITKLDGNLYYSQGRPDLQLRVSLVLKTIEVLGIVVGLRWGILGVAIGLAIAVTIGIYPTLAISGGLVGLSFSEIARNLVGVLVCSLIMGVCVYFIGGLLPPEWASSAYLMVQVSAGIVVYLLLVYLFKPLAYREMKAVVLEVIALRLGNLKLRV